MVGVLADNCSIQDLGTRASGGGVQLDTSATGFLACVAADSFPFPGDADIKQVSEKRASEGAKRCCCCFCKIVFALIYIFLGILTRNMFSTKLQRNMDDLDSKKINIL